MMLMAVVLLTPLLVVSPTAFIATLVRALYTTSAMSTILMLILFVTLWFTASMTTNRKIYMHLVATMMLMLVLVFLTSLIMRDLTPMIKPILTLPRT